MAKLRTDLQPDLRTGLQAETALPETPQAARLASLEGIRCLAALAILLYHAQLYFTEYGYTPQPTGLVNNLQRLASANSQLTPNLLLQILATPVWFGFQWVDVFVLISGFALVLSLKGRPLRLGEFYRRRFLRILLPFWTVTWLSYPLLWLLGWMTDSYRPNLWHVFAGASFPLLYQYDAQLLLPTSGPWWFMPLIFSLVLLFPLLWWLLQRWGARNLLLVSLAITLTYRAVAIYGFSGHPTYISLANETGAGWSPFLSLLAKLSTFVCGMAAAQMYLRTGNLKPGVDGWRFSKMLKFGLICYGLGFCCQFSRWGWIVADLLLPLGLTACSLVLLGWLERFAWLRQSMIRLGAHSYSYFLIHNFVVDRTIHLLVGSNLPLYLAMLPIMVVEALLFSILADYTTPLIQQVVSSGWRYLDLKLVASRRPQQV